MIYFFKYKDKGQYGHNKREEQSGKWEETEHNTGSVPTLDHESQNGLWEWPRDHFTLDLPKISQRSNGKLISDLFKNTCNPTSYLL